MGLAFLDTNEAACNIPMGLHRFHSNSHTCGSYNHLPRTSKWSVHFLDYGVQETRPML